METTLIKTRGNKLKNSIIFALKALTFYLLVSTIIRAGGLLLHSSATRVSSHSWIEPLTWFTDSYLIKRGNSYDALEMINYFRFVCDGDMYESALQDSVFYAMYEKYPDMREIYLSYMYDGITDVSTKPYNRNYLLWLLSEVTFEDFKNMPDRVEYGKWGPYEYDAVANVEEWLKKRNRERLAEVQASIRRKFSYAGPDENNENNCNGDVE